ncbi:MAG: DUF4271 domain-containing protein [Ferruginibacter sp.]
MKQFSLIFIYTLVFTASLCAQPADSAKTLTDSIKIITLADTAAPVIIKKAPVKIKNRILNMSAEPVSFAVQFKKANSKDTLFYFIAGLVLLLGLFKYFNNRYFTTLFRVFFNTSLRQSQLTDQLLQAKLPSLMFNFFFVLSGGIYIYMLLLNYGLIADSNKWILLISSIVLIGLIYFIKYCTLKFTGWVTGLNEVTDTYLFIIFLINKIIGIFLVPLIVILAFSEIYIVKVAVILSLMSIGIFLLLRFFRSYGLLQSQLKISRFHFILYLAGVELLPLLLIYKGAMVFLSKNL